MKITFLNHSHAQLIFNSFREAYNALVVNCSPRVRGQIHDGKITLAQVKTSWFDLSPYYELCYEKKLQAKFLTNIDVFQAETTGSKPFSSLGESYRKALHVFLADSCNIRDCKMKYQDIYGNRKGKKESRSKSRSKSSRSRSRSR